MDIFTEFENRIERITALLGRLNHELERFGSCSPFVTKQDLIELKQSIMSAISDYVANVTSQFGELGASVDQIVTSISGIAGDVQRIKDKLTQIENNPGQISPEDQALLTSSISDITALNTKVKAAAEVAKALDEATEEPPAPPPV